MQILFAHQNFPAQFGSFGGWLAQQGWDVVFINAVEGAAPPPGCRMVTMRPHRAPTEGVHRFALNLEKAMINAQAFANATISARAEGLNPDVVVAHSGWGSGTFAKAVWPQCKFVSYLEWYYRYPAVDAPGLAQNQTEEDARAQALTRNAPMLVDLAVADLALCPSRFQADQFPQHLTRRLEVAPDGVDTALHAPATTPNLPTGAEAIPEGAEIVTYATRGMEPQRGFPEFMQALAKLQARRPNLHAIIGGEDRVAYGAERDDGRSWKQAMLEDLPFDEGRLHFTGPLPRDEYIRLLQVSQAHVYLTVPFVLSWSMLEAMSIGCPLVASDCAPVREVVSHGAEALLVDHTDIDALADRIARLLDDPAGASALGRAARQRVLRDYDAAWVWPWRAKMLSELVRG